MIGDILCYFHAASFLGSTLQLFPAQLEFQAFSVNCTETLFRGIFKHFQETFYLKSSAWGNVMLLVKL